MPSQHIGLRAWHLRSPLAGVIVAGALRCAVHRWPAALWVCQLPPPCILQLSINSIAGE